MKYVELIIVLVAVLTPQFLMAHELDGDELIKATSGLALGGVALAAYKVWQEGKLNSYRLKDKNSK